MYCRMQMFDASLLIAKQTYSTKCYPDYDYEAEPYDCEKPCASTSYNVYGYTNEKGKATVDVSAYFSVRPRNGLPATLLPSGAQAHLERSAWSICMHAMRLVQLSCFDIDARCSLLHARHWHHCCLMHACTFAPRCN